MERGKPANDGRESRVESQVNNTVRYLWGLFPARPARRIQKSKKLSLSTGMLVSTPTNFGIGREKIMVHNAHTYMSVYAYLPTYLTLWFLSRFRHSRRIPKRQRDTIEDTKMGYQKGIFPRKKKHPIAALARMYRSQLVVNH